MARSSVRSKRKISGGRYKKPQKKLANLLRSPTLTKFAPRKSKILRERGGNKKRIILSENKINVLDKKTNKYAVTEITSLLQNPANRHYIRRGIITKGTVVETKLGKAKITSRPGQENTLNGILIG